MDAPVSGGVNAAAAGTLTFMVGAPSEKDFDSAKSILEKMGAKIVQNCDVKKTITGRKANQVDELRDTAEVEAARTIAPTGLGHGRASVYGFSCG